MATKRSHVWPLPVYVATFADGTVCRLSIGSYKKGVTYDFARGRKICCDVIGNERGRQARPAGGGTSKYPIVRGR